MVVGLVAQRDVARLVLADRLSPQIFVDRPEIVACGRSSTCVGGKRSGLRCRARFTASRSLRFRSSSLEAPDELFRATCSPDY